VESEIREVAGAVQTIVEQRRKVARERALLAGISGIDGSGKGFVTGRMAKRLRDKGVCVAVINVDGWLNLPSVRFGPDRTAQHFYGHAIRFEEMYARLVLPLRERRSLRLDAKLADPTDAEIYHLHRYEFAAIDVILLEGIFLLKRAHRDHLDVSFWIDCTFETALERALLRGQEGLPRDEVVSAYETIYFPAQRIHLERDDPRSFAAAVLINDPRLATPRS
jgi:uridine kinase